MPVISSTGADSSIGVKHPISFMEYLDERFPHPPLLPVYPVQRALSRLWITRVEKEWSTKLDILMAGKGRETVITKRARSSAKASSPLRRYSPRSRTS